MSERNSSLLFFVIVALICFSLPVTRCFGQSVGAINSPKDVPASAGSSKQIVVPESPSLENQRDTPPLRIPSPKNDGKKIETKPVEAKQELKPQTTQGVLPLIPKHEKKQMKKQSPIPVGRPDLKPEFARPERAPGPPLGERGSEEEKRKRQ